MKDDKRYAGAVLAILVYMGQAQADEPASVGIRILSLDLAQRVAVSAVQDCSKKGYQVGAAVLDRSGTLQAFARHPLAGPHTVDVSQGKAFAAATFQNPTSAMMDNEYLRFAPRALLIGGGVPIRVGGHMYGGVAVSGAPGREKTGDIDEECALAGVDAIRDDLEFAE